jgi:hypothetical protein
MKNYNALILIEIMDAASVCVLDRACGAAVASAMRS